MGSDLIGHFLGDVYFPSVIWCYEAHTNTRCSLPTNVEQGQQRLGELEECFQWHSQGPSSPVGEQSLKVSWTESSQNSTASQRHDVTEEREQGHRGASSSGCEPWSCVYLISMISIREANKIVSLYGVEVGFPQQTRRAHNPHPSHVMVTTTFLKFGVRFPLHPYFVRILNHYNLTMF